MTSQTGHTIERHPITQPIRSFISIGISIVVVVLLLVFLGFNGSAETDGNQASLTLFFEPRKQGHQWVHFIPISDRYPVHSV